MEANAVLAASHAGGIEKRFSAGGIVIVGRHVAVVGPMIWRQQARRQPRLPSQQILDDRFAVSRVGQCPPNIALRQQRVFEIERDIRKRRARLFRNFDSREAPERDNHIWRKGIERDVRGTFSQLYRPDRCIGHDSKPYLRNLWRYAEIVRITRENYFQIGLGAYETKWSCANWILCKFRTRAARHDSHTGAR